MLVATVFFWLWQARLGLGLGWLRVSGCRVSCILQKVLEFPGRALTDPLQLQAQARRGALGFRAAGCRVQACKALVFTALGGLLFFGTVRCCKGFKALSKDSQGSYGRSCRSLVSRVLNSRPL